MKPRTVVAYFINRQLGYTYTCPREKGNQHHYGRQELRELLDFIYGGPPTKSDEEIDLIVRKEFRDY